MSGDPLYRQILDRLGETVDPYRFEDCVCDLLRDAFPGLVPISGRGGDRGMDGAIADGEGEAYPLVVTTGSDLRGNLTSNLTSYRQQGGTRDKAVFATSREVSAAERRRLEEAAQANGFTLVQVIDRRGIADRLYRSPRWCRDLLRLSGEPAVLSSLPPGRRRIVEIGLVGREEDLRWLRSTAGDRLLVGEPGSGKSVLLHQLTQEKLGLFYASDDQTAIANAVRELEPAAILVDDAHLDSERLVRLRHLRPEIGAGFEIVATAWTGARERVADALGGLSATQIHTLEGLKRNKIVEIYRRMGVDIPAEGMRELVDQAANNPGLAVTLAEAFLRGEYDELIRGEALGKAVTTIFDGLIGREATPVLGVLALGGDSGMPMEAVRQALGLGILEVHQIVSDLASGGVLKETGEGILAIRPWQLGAAVVAKVFFSELALDWRTLADLAPSRDEVVRTLILAAGRGAPVSTSVLREETAQSTSKRVWRSLAHLSQDQAEWVLDQYPGDLDDVLEAALGLAPEAALPKLLAAAEHEPRRGWPATDRLAVLHAWLREVPPGGVKESMRRREVVVRSVITYLSVEDDGELAVEALCSALSPRVESSSRDPGLGDRFTISLGDELPSSTIPTFRHLWDCAKETLPPISGRAWRELRSLLREWAEPRIADRGKPEIRLARQEFAAEILRNVAARSTSNPGLSSELQKAADRLDTLDLDLGLELNPTFELLFDDDALATDDEKAEREAEMEALAARWARLDPAEVLADFRELETAAREYRSHLNFGQVPRFGTLLAAAVDYPEAWLAAALESERGFGLTDAFLRRTTELRRPAWEEGVRQGLARRRTAYSATKVVLEMDDPPEDLLAAALGKTTDFPQLVETLAVGGRIPSSTMLRLLEHPDRAVAVAAAIGEWNSASPEEVRCELRESWRAAILRAHTSERTGASPDQSLDFWLSAILASDPGLAMDWLRARFNEADTLPYNILAEENSSHSPFAVAIRSLSSAQRIGLLDSLPTPEGHRLFLRDLLTLMIGRDIELYRELLKRDYLTAVKLAPLRGRPDQVWAELADLALKHGASAEDIVHEAFSVPRTIAGSGVDYWRDWNAAFEALLSDQRPGIREIGRLGGELAQKHIRNADKDWEERQRRGF